MKKRVLFIDRDGTIVTEPSDEQLDSFDKLEFVPGVFKSLSFLRDHTDFEFVMASNQDGLGTSSYPEADFYPTHNLILNTLKGEGVEFDDILIDRHFPQDNAPTRTDPYNSLGYIPVGWFSGDFSGDNSVSHALEYYVADNAMALLATSLASGENDAARKEAFQKDAALYRARSLGYRHYYDPSSGALRPILKDGSFLTPFDPKDGADFSNATGFHEGSAWNYTYYVPHDVKGYAKLMGDSKAYVKKLQKIFDEGLYDPANEPDIAYPYLFSYFPADAWRTTVEVDKILDKYYTTAPDGIPGNDDTGTMSAWAVFSMMGFYPDCPGVPEYTFTAPAFDKITITIDPKIHGRDKLVLTKNPGRRITGIKAGGKAINGFRITHDALLKGGIVEFKCK